MVDTSSISGQSFQQPVAQTFQPGRNVEQRAEKEAIAQADPQAAKQQSQEASSAKFQASESLAPEATEYDAQAKRGSIVNIEV